MRLYFSTLVSVASLHVVLARGRNNGRLKGSEKMSSPKGSSSKGGKGKNSLPNMVVIMIDDMGWNQIGYHANAVGNDEIKTPSIDKHAGEGIIMDRGYMTPWCAPSRAAMQTGTMAAFNENVTQGIWTFDDDIGFVAGIPPTLTTLPQALKKLANSKGSDYATSYAGKWGIGGTAWSNTPKGSGYDIFRGFWSDSLEGCDGWYPLAAQGPGNGNSGVMSRVLPGYWEQDEQNVNPLCDYFKSLEGKNLTSDEVDLACSTTPRLVPKLVDDDLLDFTKDRILSHDYSEKPLFHFHSTQVIHSPQAYPAKYDNEDGQPDRFKDGSTKTTPTNDDMRLKLANLVRYIDDIFDEIMSAIKAVDQWDNTIVLFTSDNGGAIFPLNANNNYPLRGGKRAIFEGGYRVNQFLAGGWLGKGDHRISDTYVFPNDWAPTLIEMAGGSPENFLFGTSSTAGSGPMAGNKMWKYIQNSVKNKGPAQLERKVSYSPDVFYDVQETKTHKFVATPEGKLNFYIRKWAPIWPKGNDVIPDFGYVSVQPCRPDGVPSECCYFDVHSDEEEDNPIFLNESACENLTLEAQNIYAEAIDPSCSEYPTLGCAPLGDESLEERNPPSTHQEEYALWTHYGASGPFVNSKGEPIVPEENRCICFVQEDGISQAEIDAYIPLLFTPGVCINLEKAEKENYKLDLAVECSGGLVQTPVGGYVEAFEQMGMNGEQFREAAELDQKFGGVPVWKIFPLIYQYNTRENFTEWPHLSKYPYLANGLDTCTAKGVTPVVIPATGFTPWALSSGDGVDRFQKTDMCQPWNASHSWCPSIYNPFQNSISGYAPDGNWAQFDNGTKFYPIPTGECNTTCALESASTPYIKNGGGSGQESNWGMEMD